VVEADRYGVKMLELIQKEPETPAEEED